MLEEKVGHPVDIASTLQQKNGGTDASSLQGQQQPPQHNHPRGNPIIKPEHRYNQQNNHTRTQNPYTPSTSYGGMQPSSSSAPIMRTPTPSSTAHITPIAHLNMYQNRWTIKARLTSKSQIRHWSNAKGEGKLFSIELLDSTSDIRATFFKDAVDKFYDILQVDSVYTLTGGRLKAANMQYNTCKSAYEITFDQNAEICQEDDDGAIMQQNYNLIPIVALENTDPGGYVDIIGIVKNVGDPGSIMSKKTGRELSKCELMVGDDSGAEVSVTVWGDRAMQAPTEFANHPVVAFRRARLSDYGGRSLSANGDGIHIAPRVPDAERLMQWWASGGQSVVTKSLSSTMGSGGAKRFPKFEERKTIECIKNEHLGYTDPEKPDWVSFKGTFNFIKSDRDGGAWYPACPNKDDPCRNRVKVEDKQDGTYFCHRCNQTFDHCNFKYIFSATITDDTSTSWVSLFDEQARTLFNDMSADQMHEELNGQGGQDMYDGYFAQANFTDWVFTCKVKQESNDGEQRIKTSVHSIHPVDYAKEGRFMLNAIVNQ